MVVVVKVTEAQDPRALVVQKSDNNPNVKVTLEVKRREEEKQEDNLVPCGASSSSCVRLDEKKAGPSIVTSSLSSSTESDSDSDSESSSDEDDFSGDAHIDIFERAKFYRTKGNDCYKSKKYRRANAYYSKIIDLVLLEPHNASQGYDAHNASDRDEMEKDILAAAYCNRAAGWLNCGEWDQVLSDCDEVLRLGRSNSLTVKALYRRGKAHEAFGDADNARRDFENALLLEPNNRLALEAFENYKSVLHRLVVLSRASPELRSRQRKGL